MSWSDIAGRYRELIADSAGLPPLAQRWRAFADAAQTISDNPPPHLRFLFEIVRQAQGDRRADELVILEHGCGNAQALLILAALGYRNVYGIDIRRKIARFNQIGVAAGLGEERFFLYDGRRIPLPDGYVDLVFSQQVLEHVMDDVIEAYYAEEGRVLKPGGLALHQVPHRLAPYDSHTETWFVHCLPRALRRRLYRWLGHDPDYVERLLCLRWPGFHRARMIEHVGSYQDLTLRRLTEIRDFGGDGPAYDGSLALRRMVGAAIDMPVAGRLIGAILRRLVMIESLSIKRS